MDSRTIRSRAAGGHYPMVTALVPFVAGVICGNEVTLPLWLWMVALALCLVVSIFRLKGRLFGVFLSVALFVLGGFAVAVRDLLPKVPINQPVSMVLEVDQRPVVRKQFRYASARILEWEDEGLLYRGGQRVNLYVDTLVKFDLGNRIETYARVVPFPESYGSYGRLMQRRGYAGSIFLRPIEVLKLDTIERRTLHAKAVERLERLGLTDKVAAVVGAMSVGDRHLLTPELREAYARAGASHILAVSGLHVGIVFLFVNLLLWWMPILRHGQIFRALMVIVPIWLYAALCGFSPSVVRSALMFSALQLGVATSSRYVSLNALAATAFVMILYRPDYLYDISFQLSFIAVASILLYGVPIMSLLRTPSRLANALIATLVIGIAASVATMPLVLYAFGSVSIVGVLLNPIVILCAYVIVVVSIMWIVLPFAPLAAICEMLLTQTASALNFVVEGVAQWRWAALEESIPLWGVWMTYGVAIAITLILRYVETKK